MQNCRPWTASRFHQSLEGGGLQNLRPQLFLVVRRECTRISRKDSVLEYCGPSGCFEFWAGSVPSHGMFGPQIEPMGEHSTARDSHCGRGKPIYLLKDFLQITF